MATIDHETENSCPDRLNLAYIAEHGPITDRHREKCRTRIEAIEARTTRTPATPGPGDRLIAVGRNGKVYIGGHIERMTDEGQWSCCVEPYTPHVCDNGHMDKSGGYWFGADSKDLQPLGTIEKLFWCWADYPKSNGGITFEARVNVWLYVSVEQIY